MLPKKICRLPLREAPSLARVSSRGAKSRSRARTRVAEIGPSPREGGGGGGKGSAFPPVSGATPQSRQPIYHFGGHSHMKSTTLEGGGDRPIGR